MPEKDSINEVIRKGDMDELLRLIKDGDFTTKNRVLEGLSNLKSDDTVDLLIDLLQDDTIAFKAAYLLGEIGTKRATKPLLELLDTSDRILKGNTIDALAKIRDRRAVKPIMTQLEDEPWIQNRAAEALVAFGDRALKDILDELGQNRKPNQLLFYVIEQMKEKPIPLLIKSLQSESETLRGNAAYALRCIGSCPGCDKITTEKLSGATGHLVKLLSDESEFVRGNAALALAGLKEAGISKELMNLLKDKDSYPRAMAARALGIIGAEGAESQLIRLLKDPSMEVKQNAIFALGKLKAGKAVKSLKPFIKNPEQPLRLAAIRSLSLIGNDSVADDIAGALKDKDSAVRLEALKAIRDLNFQHTLDKVMEVLEDKDAEVRKMAVGLLGRIGGQEVVEPLTQALTDKDEGVVKSAVRAIAELDDESFVKPLITAMKKGRSFNYEILKTVKTIGSKDNFKEAMKKAIKVGEYDLLTGGLMTKMDTLLFSSLKDLLGGKSKKFQMNALSTVENFEKKIKDQDLIHKVVEKLTSPDLDIVKKAAEAVKSIGVPAALPLAAIMQKTSTETRKLLTTVFSDVQGLLLLENMEATLKKPTKVAKHVTREGLGLFTRLIGMVEGAITDTTRELTQLAKESETEIRKAALGKDVKVKETKEEDE